MFQKRRESTIPKVNIAPPQTDIPPVQVFVLICFRDWPTVLVRCMESVIQLETSLVLLQRSNLPLGFGEGFKMSMIHAFRRMGSPSVDYVLGRIIRIIPPYLVASSIYLLFGKEGVDNSNWIKISLVQYGPQHLWTIPVEFYFYIYLLALWLIPKIIARNIVFTISTAISLFALPFITKDPNSTNTFWYLPSFFIGYILAHVWEKIPEIKYGVPLSIASALVFVIAAPGTLYLAFNIQPSPYLQNMYAPLSAVWGIFIITTCKGPPNFVNRAFSSPAFVFLGRVSYSGYLFHMGIMVMTRRFLGPGATSLVLSIFLSLCTAFASYTLIESPSYRIRDALLKKIKPSTLEPLLEA